MSEFQVIEEQTKELRKIRKAVYGVSVWIIVALLFYTHPVEIQNNATYTTIVLWIALFVSIWNS